MEKMIEKMEPEDANIYNGMMGQVQSAYYPSSSDDSGENITLEILDCKIQSSVTYDNDKITLRILNLK